MIKIRVPATSANLGSGFDALGVSLSLYNYVYMEESDHVDISSGDGSVFDFTERNLVYRSAEKIFSLCGRSMRGLKLIQENNIPMTRGLGSSSACIVAGISGANFLLGSPLSKDELIDFAAKLEGHPDNSTPAVLGGFVASAIENGKVYNVKVPLCGKVEFAAFIPDFELPTEKARAALPKSVPHKDAVYDLSRAALLSVSLLTGKYENLGIASHDKLHQPYRMSLIKGAERVFEFCGSHGAYASYISGAGPTIMAIISPDNKEFSENARQFLNNGLNGWRFLQLKADDEGTVIQSL